LESYKYIHIGPGFNASHASIGGTTVSFVQLAEYLKNKDHNSLIFTSNRWHGFFAVCRNGLRIFYKLLKYGRQAEWIVLHASPRGVILFSPILFFFCKWYEIRWAVRVFGGNFDDYIKNGSRLDRWIFNRFSLHCNILFLQTKALMKQMSSSHAHLSWLPTSRRFPEQIVSRTVFGKRFIYVGQIHRAKGITLLQQLAESLPPDYTLHLYGPILDKQFECIQQKDYYKGMLSPDAVKNIWQNYDVLLFPSTHPGEGYPGVLIEAMATGMPVIANDWMSLHELIVDGVNGFLLQSSDPSAWLQKILMLDEMVYLSLVKNVFPSVQAFRLEQVAESMLNALENNGLQHGEK